MFLLLLVLLFASGPAILFFLVVNVGWPLAVAVAVAGIAYGVIVGILTRRPL